MNCILWICYLHILVVILLIQVAIRLSVKFMKGIRRWFTMHIALVLFWFPVRCARLAQI